MYLGECFVAFPKLFSHCRRVVVLFDERGVYLPHETRGHVALRLSKEHSLTCIREVKPLLRTGYRNVGKTAFLLHIGFAVE